MPEIAFEEVTKVYADGTRAVSSVSLTIPDGRLVVLVGPSGCGKTTLLRMVAGLESITSGQISIGGRVVNRIPPKDRDIAMVFQSYALYPHMSVFDNMSFSLRLRRMGKKTIRARVPPAARALDLVDQLNKRPRELSGGQRQRVAMGRAIVREPQALLMDEPLSNLDAKLRVEMRAEIARFQRDLGVTTIYVTHDQVEAMTLGDLVAVMRHGIIQQIDEPQALFERPANVFVAGFVGSPAMNFVEATIESGPDGLGVRFGECRFRLVPDVIVSRPALREYVGRTIVLGIRPEDIEDASLGQPSPEAARLAARVELREVMGREAFLHFAVPAPPARLGEEAVDARVLAADHARFVARTSSRSSAREDASVEFAIDTKALHFFDQSTGDSIGFDARGEARDAEETAGQDA